MASAATGGRREIALDPGGDDAGPEGFCQDEHVARLGAAVPVNPLGRRQAR